MTKTRLFRKKIEDNKNQGWQEKIEVRYDKNQGWLEKIKQKYDKNQGC